MPAVSVYYLPSVFCIFKLLLTSHQVSVNVCMEYCGGFSHRTVCRSAQGPVEYVCPLHGHCAVSIR